MKAKSPCVGKASKEFFQPLLLNMHVEIILRYIPMARSSCPFSKQSSKTNSPLSRSITSCRAGWTLGETERDGDSFSSWVLGSWTTATVCSKALPWVMELPLKQDGGGPNSWFSGHTERVRQLSSRPSKSSVCVVCPWKDLGTSGSFISNPGIDSGALTWTGTRLRCPVLGSWCKR